MLHFPLLQYQPPQSNNIFPDVLIHFLLNPFVPDPLWQKMIAGWILFSATIILTGLLRGPLAALLVSAILFSVGFGAVDTTSHYTLPLTMLLFLSVRNRSAQNLILALTVFSELLILIPLSVVLFDKKEQARFTERAIIIVLAGTASVLHSEITLTIVPIAISIIVFWCAGCVARLFNLERVMVASVIIVLILVTMFGGSAIRYVMPVIASFVIVLFKPQKIAFNWRYIAAPALALGIFSLTANAIHLNFLARQFDCFLDVLDERKIDTIAADHWTSKPLYFAALDKQQSISITQMNFDNNTGHHWMAPYVMRGAPTQYAFRSNTICEDLVGILSNLDEACDLESIGTIIDQTEICDGIELFEYSNVVPQNFKPIPNNKLDVLSWKFDQVWQKITG